MLIGLAAAIIVVGFASLAEPATAQRQGQAAFELPLGPDRPIIDQERHMLAGGQIYDAETNIIFRTPATDAHLPLLMVRAFRGIEALSYLPTLPPLHR